MVLILRSLQLSEENYGVRVMSVIQGVIGGFTIGSLQFEGARRLFGGWCLNRVLKNQLKIGGRVVLVEDVEWVELGKFDSVVSQGFFDYWLSRGCNQMW